VQQRVAPRRKVPGLLSIVPLRAWKPEAFRGHNGRTMLRGDFDRPPAVLGCARLTPMNLDHIDGILTAEM
jgi:hypothetical protein